MIQLVNHCFPAVEFDAWPQCERLRPQALACADAILQGAWTSGGAAWLLNQMAYYLHEQARYEEVEPLYRRALEIVESVLGPAHPTTAIVRANHTNLLETMKR